MYIKSKRIYFEDGVRDGYLNVEDNKIVGYLDSNAKVDEYVDYSQYRIIPGIFDTHNHASRGYAPDHSIEELKGYLKALAADGVTCIFPTVEYYKDKDNYQYIRELYGKQVDGATIMGIHSEDTERLGNRVGENGIPIGITSIDMELVKDTWENSGGLLKLCGIAPELPGSDEAIKYLMARGVRVAMMHSEANYAQAKDAFGKGVSVTTHTCNVMSGIHHRRMGGLGACILDSEVNNEIICDCQHVCPEMLEILFRVKGDFSKFLMISDNIDHAGLPADEYYANSKKNERHMFVTKEGHCVDSNGRICGSAKPVLYGIKNLVTKLNLPLETVIRMSSLNPARVYGFDSYKGSIKIGKDADFVIIDDDYNCLATYACGKKVFDKDVDTDLINHKFYEEWRVKKA